MPRPTTNGKYTVPKEIAALKPSDVNCFIKVIYAGTAKHYYVYASDSIPGPGSSDKSKRSSGPVIGKIEGGQFIPNAAYLEMKSGHSAGLDDAQRSKLSDSDRTEATHIAPGISGVDLDNYVMVQNLVEMSITILAGERWTLEA